MWIVLLWLVSFVIMILVLQWVITSAINSSELAKDLREIKVMLKNRYANELKMNTVLRKNAEHEECPACGEQVLSTDEICASCGLTLIILKRNDSLMDKRYPIGQFCYEGEISPTQREEWIREISDFPLKLREAVKNLSEDQLDLTYREGGWTLRQVVHHLADSHMNSFIRFKLALTEDTPTIKPYFEDRWAELQDSVRTDINLSIKLLEALHHKWVILLKSMTDSDYKKQFFHPESKKLVALDYNLGIYAWHGKHHIAHITTLRNERDI